MCVTVCLCSVMPGCLCICVSGLLSKLPLFIHQLCHANNNNPASHIGSVMKTTTILVEVYMKWHLPINVTTVQLNYKVVTVSEHF